MQSYVFATNNLHKLQEISNIFENKIKLISLNKIGCSDEIPEDYETLEENAHQKANYIFKKYKLNSFADDTGLEVEALYGKPGVHSARYSEKEFPNVSKEMRTELNINKLMKELQDKENRKAAFRTVICLIENGQPQYFEGKIEGYIIKEKRGLKGFGYDPVFIPEGYSKTFAEMDLETKNLISHRAKAIQKLFEYFRMTFDQ